MLGACNAIFWSIRFFSLLSFSFMVTLASKHVWNTLYATCCILSNHPPTAISDRVSHGRRNPRLAISSFGPFGAGSTSNHVAIFEIYALSTISVPRLQKRLPRVDSRGHSLVAKTKDTMKRCLQFLRIVRTVSPSKQVRTMPILLKREPIRARIGPFNTHTRVANRNRLLSGTPIYANFLVSFINSVTSSRTSIAPTLQESAET